MKLWGGRFTKQTAKSVEEFTASITFDACLYEADILGSLAHVKMLGQCDILQKEEVDAITQGLQNILQKINDGKVKFNIADEDIHMNIERLLYEEIGDIAGKLHTGRSRNDQIALDLHLYLREKVLTLIEKTYLLQKTIVEKAKEHIDTIMPGYTHLQRAIPVSFAHHLLCYVAMLQRDIERLKDSFPRINTLPLGAGALAGSGFNTDRKYLAKLLGFSSIYENSIDAVSDRDFIVEFLAHSSILIMHLSRFSEELILWNSKEFSFIEFDDAYCTGSSMMPQKKNPDVAELVRGKTGRVYGALFSILTILKGLPLAYNKDMQEDKESLFDVIKTLENTLSIYSPMLATLKINKQAMLDAVKNDFLNATQLANYLANKGIPFRKAHSITGEIVLHCIEHHKLLTDLPITTYQEYSSLIDDEIYSLLTPENVMATYNVQGGTSKEAIIKQLKEIAIHLEQTTKWLKNVEDNTTIKL